jgi:hypothetical protein
MATEELCGSASGLEDLTAQCFIVDGEGPAGWLRLRLCDEEFEIAPPPQPASSQGDASRLDVEFGNDT